MVHSLLMSEPYPQMLLLLMMLAVSSQVPHLYFVGHSRALPHHRLVICYESVLLLFWIVQCCLAVVIYNINFGFPESELAFWGHVASWCALLMAVFSLAVTAVTKQGLRLGEAALFLLLSPLNAFVVSAYFMYVALPYAALLIVRHAVAYAVDYGKRRERPSSNAALHALRRLPNGVAVIDGQGMFLLVNNCMHNLLAQAGLFNQYYGGNDLWQALSKRGKSLDSESQASPNCFKVELGESGVWLFLRSEAYVGGLACIIISADNVTEEERLNESLERAGADLEEMGQRLRQELAVVNRVAHDEAVLNVSSRVHDVIGQRLSIIHRYLEDNRLDESSLKDVAALCANMRSQLLADEDPNPTDELSALVGSYALAGMDICLSGHLPDDGEVARAFAWVVREAATNALRHGNATRLDVVMSSDGKGHRLSIEDDGTGCAMVVEGTGLRGMRRSLDACGGSLDVCSLAPFGLEAVVPR